MYRQISFDSVLNYNYSYSTDESVKPINKKLKLVNQNSKHNVIRFPKKKVSIKNKSLYTKQGKLKATAADSIKSIEEIKLIKKYFLDRKQYRNYAFLVIGISTGYRCGDLLGLKFKDLLNNNGTWKREIDIIEQKTEKRRSVEILPSIKNAVQLYIKGLGIYNLEGYIFKSRKGSNSPMQVSSMRKIFIDMAKELSLPYHCSTHFLRKTFAYWFLQLHKNDITALSTLQDILNHSSERITLKYCGIAKEKQQEMIRNVSELL